MALAPEQLPLYFLFARYLFALLFLLLVYAVARRRTPGVLVVGTAILSLVSWVLIQAPLARLWSLASGHDRLFNLAKYATAATGHSIFESWEVASTELEPFWRLAMRLVCLGEPERALAAYQYLTPIVLILLPLSLYLALRPKGEDLKDASHLEARWELALTVYAVMMFNSAPMDRFGVFQTFWQMNLLLKPNHAFGFVLIPWCIWAWRSDRRPVKILVAGGILSLLAWVFLLHWAYVATGLSLCVLMDLGSRRTREALDGLTAILISGLGTLPYLIHLARNYGWESGGAAAQQLWHKPGYEAGYYDLFSVSLEHGTLFFFSLAGIVLMVVRRGRQDRLWLALLAGAAPWWVLQFPLFYLRKAGEPDELYFFVRFLLALCAGKGAFFSLRIAHRLFASDHKVVGAKAVSVILLLSLPLSFPYWWNPLRMDRYFHVGLHPIPGKIDRLAEWIRTHTDPDAVFLAESDTAVWIAALSGRRGFLNRQRPPRDYVQRRWLERALLTQPSEKILDEIESKYHVTHLALEPDYLSGFGVEMGRFEGSSWLELVFAVEELKVFRVRYDRQSLSPSVGEGRRP